MADDPIDDLDDIDDGPADPDRPRKDGMHPPTIPIMVGCIHCGETYDSWRIEWRVEQDEESVSHGRWCCPIPGCDGAGFGFDIWPIESGTFIDPDGRELHVWEDDEDDEELEEEFEEDFDDGLLGAEWSGGDGSDANLPRDDFRRGGTSEQAPDRRPDTWDEDDIPF